MLFLQLHSMQGLKVEIYEGEEIVGWKPMAKQLVYKALIFLIEIVIVEPLFWI